MKKNHASRVLCLLAVCALALAGCARAPKELSDEEAYKRFVGTWENPETQVSQTFARVVVQPDYVMEFWVRRDPKSTSTQKIKVTVKKTWVDAEGGTCFHFFFVIFEAGMGKGLEGLGLMRLDKARKVFELNQKLGKENDTYPDQIERKSPGDNWTWYMIFYRK